VFLHGSGDRGNDPKLIRTCGLIDRKLPAIVVAPQCLPIRSWEPDAVAAFIQHVQSRYKIDRQRIYLLGYSMGGSGTWLTAGSHPELFAAIVPICGSGNESHATALAGLPIWAFHGEEDEVVPLDQSKKMIEAAQNAGGKPRFTIIPRAGHGICDMVCARDDLWLWLFGQSRR